MGSIIASDETTLKKKTKTQSLQCFTADRINASSVTMMMTDSELDWSMDMHEFQIISFVRRFENSSDTCQWQSHSSYFIHDMWKVNASSL